MQICSQKLTKFIRLSVYSYLDFQTLLQTVSKLSKNERSILKNSYIVNESISLIFQPDNLLSKTCVLHDDMLQTVLKRIVYAFSLGKIFTIIVDM